MMEGKKRQLLSLIQNKNTPNILFHGPYLRGKEILSKLFVDILYQNQEDKNKYVLWINCLYGNGIQTMKQNIKLFAMQIMRKETHLMFKTIILQYAEHLTNDSQYCLRRTIEQYNHHTRFVILCENKHKLLQPICSRFVQIYVNIPLNKQEFILCDTFRYNIYNRLMKKYNSIVEKNKPYKDMFHLAKEFYDKHFFALELLQRMKKYNQYQEISFLFNLYCKEFRNETLSIFFILNIFRNKSNIQIYSIL